MINVSSNLATLLDKDHITPELKVTLYDTTKTVPSNGFDVKYYTFDSGQDLTITDWVTGSTVVESLDGNEFSTVLSFDWGEGAPPPVSQVDNYGARWSGFFYARYTGSYTFYTDSGPLCGSQVKIDGSYLTFTDPNGTTGSAWQGEDLQTKITELSATVAMTAGQWYPIEIDFYTGSNKNGASLAYFTAKYQEPSGATTDLDIFGDSNGVTDYASDSNKKPLSAGVVNNIDGWLSGVTLTGITSYDLDRPFGEVAQAAFNVNLSWVSVLNRADTGTASTDSIVVDSASGAPSVGVLEINGITRTYNSKSSNTFTLDTAISISAGTVVKLKDTPYAYDKDSGSFGIIKQLKLARFQIGMVDAAGTTYYVDRLWGNIFPDPSVSRSKDGVSELTVLVQDFSFAMNTDYNKNYPNQSSYSMAGLYNGSTFGRGANGLTRPVAFDGWLLDDVMRDLAIKANIDPVWMYGRKQVSSDASFVNAYSDYYVRGEDIYLEKKPFYGNPGNTTEESADSEYIWSFGYGETLLSMAYDFCKNFGYGFSFNELGYMSFNGMDIPQEKLFATDYATSGTVVIADDTNWTKTPNLSSPKGIDMVTSSSGETIIFTVNGKFVDLILTRDQAAASVNLKIDENNVAQVKMDGTTIAQASGNYDIDYSGTWSYYDGIDPNGATNHSVIRINMGSYGEHTLTVYSNTAIMKVAGCFSYDVLSTESVLDMDTTSIEKLDDSLSFADMRNEVIVIGSLLGKFSNTGGGVINPNNPIYRHVISSAVDLNSLYNTNVKNYTGRLIPFEIYNPKIFSKDRADYLATTVLDKYRRAQHSPEFDVKPNPRLQLLDGITLTDIHTGLTSTSDSLWVVGYREGLKLDSSGILYEMDTRLTGHKPLMSFSVKDDPDTEADFNNNPVINVIIKNSGKRICGSGSGSSLVWTVDYSPEWIVDMWKGHELWVSGHPDRWLIVSNTSNTLTIHADSTTSLPATGYSSISFDPFDSDRGSPIELHYDQVSTGKVKVEIVNSVGRKLADINESKETEVEDWGANKVLYWDGSDSDNNGFFTVNQGPFFVVISIFIGDSVVLSMPTDRDSYANDSSVINYRQEFSSKILNHGIYAEIEPINVTDGDATEWSGVVDSYEPDLYRFHDGDLPAVASGWAGKVIIVNERKELDPGVQYADRPFTIVSVDVGSKMISVTERILGGGTFGPYRIVSRSPTLSTISFDRHDNSSSGFGYKITPVPFFVKSDSAPVVIAKRADGDIDVRGYRVPMLDVLSRVPEMVISYKGTEYSPGFTSEVLNTAPIPFSGKRWLLEAEREHVADWIVGDYCQVLYWNSFKNEFFISSIHSYLDGGYIDEEAGTLDDLVVAKKVGDLREETEASTAMVRQFGKLRDGLFALHTVWPRNYPQNSQEDFVISYSHHNHLAPDKASPAPYGKVIVKIYIDSFYGNTFNDTAEYDAFDSGGIINIDGLELFFNPIGKTISGKTIGDFKMLTNDEDRVTYGKIAWRVRVYVDIYDRAGRKSGNTRPGIIRDGNLEFDYMKDASNYIESWWIPDNESDYSRIHTFHLDVSDIGSTQNEGHSSKVWVDSWLEA